MTTKSFYRYSGTCSKRYLWKVWITCFTLEYLWFLAKLNGTTLETKIDDDSVLHVIWDNPKNTLRDSFIYVVSATVVKTGEMVEEPRTIAFAIDTIPHIDIELIHYTCEQVNISIHVCNSNEGISQVVTPPACTFAS